MITSTKSIIQNSPGLTLTPFMYHDSEAGGRASVTRHSRVNLAPALTSTTEASLQPTILMLVGATGGRDICEGGDGRRGCIFLGCCCVVVLRSGDVDFWAVVMLCRCVVVLSGSVSGGVGVIAWCCGVVLRGGVGVVAWWRKALYIRDSDAGKNVLEISVRENCYADELSQSNRPLFGVENPTQTYVFHLFPLRIET